MHRTTRQATIMRALGAEGAASVADLAQRLSVSGETIRRDVKSLALRGLVERVHGGVVLPQSHREPTFQKRMERHAEAKRRIARCAAGQIQNGQSLMLDTGSTTAYVARALADHEDLLIVTNCTEIAGLLVDRNRVYLVGGELRADDRAVFGDTAIRFVEQFRADFAVLSIGAMHPEDGLMDFHLVEAEFSRAVMRRSAATIVVADHSKFGIQAPVRVSGYEAIDILVTDRPPPESIEERVSEAGARIFVAE